MASFYRRLVGIFGAASLVAVFMAIGVISVAADEKGATCSNGSVAPGHYDSLTITGFCNVDSGNVTVNHNLTIAPGGGLNAAFSGSDLTVGHD
ncbi:MAG: hypothetical protein E6J08_11780, partial [Chloroflexi bacterium]